MFDLFISKARKAEIDATRAQDGCVELLTYLRAPYSVKQDGTITVHGNLNITSLYATKLPDMSKVEVEGNFNCSHNRLTSLATMPRKVTGDYDCSFNQLESLEGVPQDLGRSLNARSNRLKSLKGAPKKINGDFDCSDNQMESLEDGPAEVSGNYDCWGGWLTTLKGAPRHIKRRFNCNSNDLHTLDGAPEEVDGHFMCGSFNLVSLMGGPKRVGGDYAALNASLENLDHLAKSFNRLVLTSGIYDADKKRIGDVKDYEAFAPIPEKVPDVIELASPLALRRPLAFRARAASPV